MVRSKNPIPTRDDEKEDHEYRVKLVVYGFEEIKNMGYAPRDWTCLLTDMLYLRMFISLLEILKEKTISFEEREIIRGFLGELYRKLNKMEGQNA